MKLRMAGDNRRVSRTTDCLITPHLPLAYQIAYRVQRSIARDADFDDLVSAATLGLMHAMNNFDPGRGLAFSTYAAPRIRGAILDELRRWDHAPRSIRRKQRQIARANDAAVRRLGRAPTDAELANELDISLERLWAWKATAEETVRVSIDQPTSDRASCGAAPLEALIGNTGDDIEENVATREEIELLKVEIARLKTQQRIVLSLYFFQELKLCQIAEVLGLTESRISQIRTSALQTLRARMSHLRGAA